MHILSIVSMISICVAIILSIFLPLALKPNKSLLNGLVIYLVVTLLPITLSVCIFVWTRKRQLSPWTYELSLCFYAMCVVLIATILCPIYILTISSVTMFATIMSILMSVALLYSDWYILSSFEKVACGVVPPLLGIWPLIWSCILMRHVPLTT